MEGGILKLASLKSIDNPVCPAEIFCFSAGHITFIVYKSPSSFYNC